MRRFLFLLPAIALALPLFGQAPQKPDAAAIFTQIQKLNFLGSVLYIGAHPDDENTRLIAWLSNDMHARTGYLSLTRGDGGQNLIGPQLREGLGVIRTQELLEARKIDGGQQFFTRANDFGYSKTPDETLKIWNKDDVLSDVVWTIRKFRPDVIIDRFDARTPGTTHGHHTASAILSLEAFDKAADANAYPQQLTLVRPWQPKRTYFNTSWWFYGSKEKFDRADKSNLTQLSTGTYYSLLGKSNQEIAALSRSRHQSQGFGSTGTRGDETEYLEWVKGDRSKTADIFDGIDTSWNRVKGGKAIGEILAGVEKDYDFKNPAASIPKLLEAYKLIHGLDDDHWKRIKSDEIKNVIAACAGLYLEAIADSREATPGSAVKIKLEAINRSAVAMNWTAYRVLPGGERVLRAKSDDYALSDNTDRTEEANLSVPENQPYTSPYWLRERGTVGMYRVDNQQDIGLPEIPRQAKVIFDIDVMGQTLDFNREIVYKYNDPVKGEVYEPFDIVPDVTTSIPDKVVLFNRRKTKDVYVSVRAGKDNVSGIVQLEVPAGWHASPASIPFSLARRSQEQTLAFSVTAPKEESQATVTAVAVVDGKRFDRERKDIVYPHIPRQMVLMPSEAKLLKLDIKTGNEKIAYIMGAGDQVDKSLAQMGYEVTLVRADDISMEKLAPFDVIITGIRAYNTIDALAMKQHILLNLVKAGKTMIVQYNTPDGLVTKDLAPYPLHLSRDRVTEENAEVSFLSPDSPALNHPNKITPEDFHGWTQEQGLYYPDTWDKAFQTVISSHDTGEKPKDSAILVARYGKGYYIYTGLSFFRELPEGVPGAMRLMANLISTGH